MLENQSADELSSFFVKGRVETKIISSALNRRSQLGMGWDIGIIRKAKGMLLG